MFIASCRAASAAPAASAASAAQAAPAIPANGSSGNDGWNGLNSTWTSGLNGPKATISNAVNTVTTNGTVNVASGTYTESGMNIQNNMTIIGENPENTIIDGQSNQIININSGTYLTLINLTLENGNRAISNYGTLTLINCTFYNNNAMFDGAIYNYKGSILNVENCMFNKNNATMDSGAIYNDRDSSLIVDNSTFMNNVAGTNGGAISNFGTLNMTNSVLLDNVADTNNIGDNPLYPTDPNLQEDFTANGGAVYNVGNSNITNCVFTQNSAEYGGAIYNTGIFDIENSILSNNIATEDGGAIYTFEKLNINESTLTNNQANRNGGTIWNNGNANVNFNRILRMPGSEGNIIFNNAGAVNATLNWWGSNTNPSNYVVGNINVTPWVVLTISANPASILNGSNSTVTADLQHDSNGNYLNPINGLIPDDMPVTFTGTLGSINPNNTGFMGDEVKSLFTAIDIGNANVTAKVDNQSVSTIITVNPIVDLYLTMTSKGNPKVGETFTITYKLGNKGPNNATNVIVTIPLPKGFVLTGINGDGNWTYNTANSTITWTLTNVTVGDPYLYVTGKTTSAGNYIFNSSLTSETYNLNTQGVTPITITSTNPINPTNHTTPTTKTIFNTATSIIPMQHTGIPIAGLLFGILSVIGGSVMSHKK